MELKEMIADLMQQARKKAGGDVNLAELIQPLVGRRYSKQVVGAWALGKIMPPTIVFLAACKATGLQVDDYLYGASLKGEVELLRDKVERDARVVSSLEALVRELGERLGGLPEPKDG